MLLNSLQTETVILFWLHGAHNFILGRTQMSVVKISAHLDLGTKLLVYDVNESSLTYLFNDH